MNDKIKQENNEDFRILYKIWKQDLNILGKIVLGPYMIIVLIVLISFNILFCNKSK